MRVAVNAKSLLTPLTGVGQYTRNLLEGLYASGEVELELFYGLRWSGTLRTEALRGVGAAKRVARHFVPTAGGLARLAQQAAFGRGARRLRPDLYHEPSFLAYRFDGPMVVTIHDLSFHWYPQFHPAVRVRTMNALVPESIARARFVLTDSEFVRGEIVSVYGVAPEKVKAIHLGVAEGFRPRQPSETAGALARAALRHGEYVLSVGTLEPRKNLSGALRAYSMLPEDLRGRFPLAIVGMKGWHTEAMERDLEPLVRCGQVRLLGYVPGEDLAAIYAGAVATIYPSIYEGFGLPPLESMACGTPVIASNRASLPEVVGDAGIQVDPGNSKAMSEALRRLIEDQAARRELAKRSLVRARQFTWSRCVARTLEVYRAALA